MWEATGSIAKACGSNNDELDKTLASRFQVSASEKAENLQFRRSSCPFIGSRMLMLHSAKPSPSIDPCCSISARHRLEADAFGWRPNHTTTPSCQNSSRRALLPPGFI